MWLLCILEKMFAFQYLFDEEDEKTVVNNLEEDYGSLYKGNHLLCAVENYNDIEFRKTFRLNKQTFSLLLSEITKHYKESHKGRKELALSTQLLVFLKYIGSQQTLFEISHGFSTPPSVIHGIIRKINSLFQKISAELISFPSDFEVIADGFSKLAHENLPRVVIGAIDCRETPIIAPIESKESYYNRKNFYSIKLQALVGPDCEIFDAFIGWPGRSHDSKCFHQSVLFQKLENGAAKNFAILGDSAYPLKKYLIPPVKDNGHLTNQQRTFNYRHSQARTIVERTFGQMVSRFRRLKFIHMFDLKDICELVLSICCIHNFCIFLKEEIFEYTLDEDNDDSPEDDPVDDESSRSGQILREYMIEFASEKK